MTILKIVCWPKFGITIAGGGGGGFLSILFINIRYYYIISVIRFMDNELC